MSATRSIVKIVANTAVHTAMISVSTVAIETVVDPSTEAQEASCELGGFVVGSLIWWKTRYLVDATVDVVADRMPHRKPKLQVVDQES